MPDFMRLYRERQADQIDEIPQLPDSSCMGSTSLVVVTTTDGSYPVVAGTWYTVQVTELSGDEKEGGTVSATTPSGTAFYALNLGTAIPPIGTKLVITQLDGIWTFTYN